MSRESEWDEQNVGEAYALYEADLLICPDCGNLRSVCSDPSMPWYPQRTICHARKNLDAIRRIYDAKHKDWKPGREPFGPQDGVHLWVAPDDLTPDDLFL